MTTLCFLALPPEFSEEMHVTQLGELLRKARQEKGVSLEEAATATHIQPQYLEALEQNNLAVFASPVVARGLIRNYARYLELDPVEALTLYDGKGRVPVKGQRLTPNGIEFMNLSMTRRSAFSWELLIGLVLVLVLAGGGWYLVSGNIVEASVTATPTKTPLAAGLTEESALLLPTVTPLPSSTPTPLPPTDTPTPVIYAGVEVELVLQQSSWVQILADDVKVFEGILQPGDRENWRGERRVAIRAGNGGGVEVIVNGTSRGLMGAEGQVVDQIWEKVEDPGQLANTPAPASTSDPTATGEPTSASTAVTSTPNILQEPPPTPSEGEVDGEPIPLESAPEGEGSN
jgi:cytoskeleton protein RodZ